ncbi:MAG: hypothetical protein JXQ83_12605 [Candidatus Glassbacteria bacterium]|nr:hypothetical protein [Candidatus Glassbacteria bacterium]
MFTPGRIILALSVAVIALAGCSGSQMSVIGSERVIDRSGDAPKWVYKIPKEDKEYYYFRGFKTHALSLEDGLTDARSNAIRQVLEMIQAQGLVDYKKTRVEHGLAEKREDIGSLTSDGLKILSKTVAMGVKELESYTEKVERTTAEGVRYAYNVYTLVRYPKDEFDKAVALAVSERSAETRQQNDKEAGALAEELDKGLPTY